MSKETTTSSNSETPKIKSALLDKYEKEDQKEVEGYERLKTKESAKKLMFTSVGYITLLQIIYVIDKMIL